MPVPTLEHLSVQLWIASPDGFSSHNVNVLSLDPRRMEFDVDDDALVSALASLDQAHVVAFGDPAVIAAVEIDPSTTPNAQRVAVRFLDPASLRQTWVSELL